MIGAMGGIGGMDGMTGASMAGGGSGAGTDALSNGGSIDAPPPGITVTISDASKTALARDTLPTGTTSSLTPSPGIDAMGDGLAPNVGVQNVDSNSAGQGMLNMENLEQQIASLLLALMTLQQSQTVGQNPSATS